METTVLMPLPERGFDPTESAVPWEYVIERGGRVIFATPEGNPAEADPRMVTGEDLGPWSFFLKADEGARRTYRRMEQSPAFNDPLSFGELEARAFEAIVLPGGHAPGMKTYLESEVLQRLVARHMKADKPLGAICHGVVLAARATDPETNESILKGRKTTALLRSQELIAWLLTALWLGDYYRTYPTTVESEVKSALASPSDFVKGPFPLGRDSADDLEPGFAFEDGLYLSARWPGDAHQFADRFCEMIGL